MATCPYCGATLAWGLVYTRPKEDEYRYGCLVPAIGALAGATVGQEGIPSRWLSRIWDWPRGVSFLRELGHRLSQTAEGQTEIGPVQCFWPGLLVRGVVFQVAMLLHIFRRLLPPY